MMGNHRLFFYNPKLVRKQLNKATDLALHIHESEKSLIQMLYDIDQKRFYVRYGFNSLTGFCRFGLQFSKTQAQRIVTLVRRYEPTDNFVDRRSPRGAEATNVPP